MDEVFRAIGDPHRRHLLDRLAERDGQTLVELTATLEPMTRFGVAKHLAVLEEVGLVVSKREGRRKFHFLNPVPIRLIHDRWISRFAEPFVRTLSDMKRDLEGAPEVAADGKHVFEVYIRATPERIWQAITDPAETHRYFFSTAVESTFRKGEPIVHRSEDGSEALRGVVLECEPPRRLVTTWTSPGSPDTVEHPTTVSWELEPTEDGHATKVTLVHSELEIGSNLYQRVHRGWSIVLSGLKTWVETGEPLEVA
jgi:uncharacterized protein YndB with AHSA1/START domain/DNA-binding transcriptional ArsR family regulator